MSRDLHNKPFDEGTMAKLDLFRFYLREWLPVFISAKNIYWKTINIYDFFAGPGKDINNVKGTPLIILEELQPYINEIEAKGLTVNLYLNEYDKKKCRELIQNIDEDENASKFNIEIESLDFQISFNKKYPSLIGKDNANLLFLDQTGIKQINPQRFERLLEVKRTDFLFFISSSTIKRFPDHPTIAKHINLNTEEVVKTPFHKIHGLVLEFYKSLIPTNMKYYLAPFSIKKKSGLYGVIFGSHNVLGLEKFLNAAWKIDPERGTANFDIDNDNIIPGQVDLFTGKVQKPKKIEVFETNLRQKILTKEITTDKDIYLCTLESGMKVSHGRGVIKKLITENRIEKASFELSNKVCKRDAKITLLKHK